MTGPAPRRQAPPTPARSHGVTDGLTPFEVIAVAGLAAVLAGGLLVWATGWLLTGGQPDAGVTAAPAQLLTILGDPADPAAAWPESSRRHIPGPIGFYTTLLALLALPLAAGTWLVLRLGGRLHAGRQDARWATRSDLRDLRVHGPGGGRVVLGHHHPSRRLLATEPGRSLLVLGPSRSGKTTGLAIPAILEWEGPVVATSVKTDLVRDTAGWRATRGQVQLFDPTGATGLPAAGWSPLSACDTWMGAVRTAHTMAATVKSAGAGGLTDGDFWYASAAKLLAPLLFAAAHHHRPIGEVVAWLDTQEVTRVRALLAETGVVVAVNAFTASVRRADNQRSSIYTTAETVLAAYQDPDVAAAASRDDIDPDRLLNSNDTLYLCAPRDDQRRLRPLFVGLLHHLLAVAGRHAASSADGRLDRPLLIVLDEAANIAPLPDLDELASTAMGLGITLVTIWQDLAQIRARYGQRATTIVNNHAGMLVLRGMRDLDALHATSDLLGRHTPPEDPRTGRTAPAEPLLPAHALRSLPDGRAIGIYQHLPPFQVSLRPHYRHRHLAARAALPPPATGPHTSDPPVPNGRAVRHHDGAAATLAVEDPVHPGIGPPAGGHRAHRARRTAPTLADVQAHTREILAEVATVGAANPRIFGSVATATAVAGSDINLLVDLPRTDRLLHTSNLSRQLTDLLGHPVTVLCPEMLQDPHAADHAIPLALEPETMP